MTENVWKYLFILLTSIIMLKNKFYKGIKKIRKTKLRQF